MSGIIIADDDIAADKLRKAAETCGGWEKISYIDTDAEDSFVCIDGREYAFEFSFVLPIAGKDNK